MKSIRLKNERQARKVLAGLLRSGRLGPASATGEFTVAGLLNSDVHSGERVAGKLTLQIGGVRELSKLPAALWNRVEFNKILVRQDASVLQGRFPAPRKR